MTASRLDDEQTLHRVQDPRTSRALAAGVALLAAIGLIIALVPGVPVPAHAVIGVAVVIVAPGLGLLLAVHGLDKLTIARGTVFTIAASLALAVLVGVILAATPVGLTRTTAPVTLECLAILLAGISLLVPPRHADEPTRKHLSAMGDTPHRVAGGVLLVVALLVTIAAVVVAHIAADRSYKNGRVTALSLHSTSGTRSVRLEVTNRQPTATSFRLRVTARRPGQNTPVVLETTSLDVSKEATRGVTVAVPSGVALDSVRGALFVAGRSQPLRVVGLQR